MNLAYPSDTAPVTSRLGNVLFNILDSLAVVSPGPWPWATTSDFTQAGDVTVTVDHTGKATLAFAGGLQLTGILNLQKLDGILQMTAPNYSIAVNNGQSLNPGQLTGNSVSLGVTMTRQRLGAMLVSAVITGTQAGQALVAGTLYRDFGLAGQQALAVAHVAPGGLGGFDWTASVTVLDILPDRLPHTYTLVCTGTSLTVPQGQANVQAFEIGAPA